MQAPAGTRSTDSVVNVHAPRRSRRSNRAILAETPPSTKSGQKRSALAGRLQGPGLGAGSSGPAQGERRPDRQCHAQHEERSRWPGAPQDQQGGARAHPEVRPMFTVSRATELRLGGVDLAQRACSPIDQRERAEHLARCRDRGCPGSGSRWSRGWLSAWGAVRRGSRPAGSAGDCYHGGRPDRPPRRSPLAHGVAGAPHGQLGAWSILTGLLPRPRPSAGPGHRSSGGPQVGGLVAVRSSCAADRGASCRGRRRDRGETGRSVEGPTPSSGTRTRTRAGVAAAGPRPAHCVRGLDGAFAERAGAADGARAGTPRSAAAEPAGPRTCAPPPSAQPPAGKPPARRSWSARHDRRRTGLARGRVPGPRGLAGPAVAEVGDVDGPRQRPGARTSSPGGPPTARAPPSRSGSASRTARIWSAYSAQSVASRQRPPGPAGRPPARRTRR